ncbi:MAG: methionyl-tRNA formyltransferase [Acidimicrobiales bacterium]
MVVLRALAAAGHDVVMVVSRPDKRRGRNEAPQPSPVKAAASQLGLRVTDRPEDVIGAGADLGVVVAFGRIIKADVLAALDLVNVHFSLLPRWRGAAPVERAILAGDTVTGVCLMAIDDGLDTGPVYRCEEVPIGGRETAAALSERLAQVGADLLVKSLGEGLPTPAPQEGDATYAAKIEAGDRMLRWERPAAELERVVRVGRAWTTWRSRRLLVLDAEPVVLDAEPVPPPSAGAGASPPPSAGAGASPPPSAGAPPPGTVAGEVVVTGDGGLRLLTVQPEGRRPVTGTEWIRGARPAIGEVLGG